MSDRPLISVIVFVLNAANTIDRALRSVTADDQPTIELLILDGGSTDGTVDVIRRYESKISYWRSFPDGGATNAINEGVRRASGDVICLLPADDWIEKGALHHVCDEFAADPELEVLSCGTRFVRLDADGSIQVEAEFLDPKILEFSMKNIVRFPLTVGRFMRRELYAQVGAFSSEYFISNDLDFLIRVVIRKPRSKVLPQLVYTFRQHPGSRTQGGNRDLFFVNMRENAQIAANHLAESSLTPDENRALLGLHGRSSARLAWMQLCRREIGDAVCTIRRAVGLNPMWPVQMLLWFTQKILRDGRGFQSSGSRSR